MGELFLSNSMQAIKAILNEEVIDDYCAKFQVFKRLCDFEKIDYCIDKYIATELDYHTNGIRGIGRMNDNIPRFGGYFRRHLSNLPEEITNELGNLFKQSIYIGYLTHVLTFEEKPKTSVTTSGQMLFEKWIPEIYVSNIEKAPNLRNFIYGSVSETLLTAKTLMKNYKFKGGGLFSEDKTDLILSYYPQSGFGLRARE